MPAEKPAGVSVNALKELVVAGIIELIVKPFAVSSIDTLEPCLICLNILLLAFDINVLPLANTVFVGLGNATTNSMPVPSLVTFRYLSFAKLAGVSERPVNVDEPAPPPGNAHQQTLCQFRH